MAVGGVGASVPFRGAKAPTHPPIAGTTLPILPAAFRPPFCLFFCIHYLGFGHVVVSLGFGLSEKE